MAIKHAGSLTKKLGIPKGAKVPQVKLRKASAQVPKGAAKITGTLSGFNKKKDPMVY